MSEEANFTIKIINRKPRKRYKMKFLEPELYDLTILKAIRINLYKKWYMKPFSKWWIQYEAQYSTIPLSRDSAGIETFYSSNNIFDFKWWKDPGYDFIYNKVCADLKSERGDFVPNKWYNWHMKFLLNKKLKKINS